MENMAAKHEQQLVSSSFNLSQSEAGQELANMCAHMELHYPTIYIASFPVMYVALSHKETLFRHRMFYFRLHVISLSCVTWHWQTISGLYQLHPHACGWTLC